MACKFWTDRFNAETKMYACPKCPRELKAKTSNSAKNPGRSFVSCSPDFGGCDMFCFLDEEPRERQQFPKRARAPNHDQPIAASRAPGMSGGAVITAPADIKEPGVVEQRLADLAAEVAALRGELHKILEYIEK